MFSLKHFAQTYKHRLFVPILLLFGLLRFVNLGFEDLQAWDEALYAVRAETVIRFGDIFDQTPHAIGGLYSSLHPPLYIWLTALAFEVGGIGEFTARFWSAVFGMLTLFVIFRIGERLHDRVVGFVGALLFGLHPFVTFYSRQGQLDASLVFFLSLAILGFIESRRQFSFRSAIIAGAAIGFGLMTKLHVAAGLFVVHILSIYWLPRSERSRGWKTVGIAAGVAAIISIPWHVMMTMLHGDGNPLFFLEASALFERTFTGIEGNVKALGVLYYVNQLLVLFPLGVVWFAYGFPSAIRQSDSPWMLVAAWFVIFFLIFSLMRTQLEVYLLPMLVPASLLAARTIVLLAEDSEIRQSFRWICALTFFSVVWSLDQEGRNGVKEVLGSLFSLSPPRSPDILATVTILGGALTSGIIVWILGRSSYVSRVRSALPWIVLVPLSIASMYTIVIRDIVAYKDGAVELTRFIEEGNIGSIVIAGYDRNPQFTYYLDGADIGWRDDFRVRRIFPPPEPIMFRSWLQSEMAGEGASTVLVVEKDKLARYHVFEAHSLRPMDYVLVFDSRRYAVFRRQAFDDYAHLERAGTISFRSMLQ